MAALRQALNNHGTRFAARQRNHGTIRGFALLIQDNQRLDNSMSDKNDESMTDNPSNNETLEEESARLDVEIHLWRQINIALTSTLRMLETARDDLTEMGERMDRLTVASQRCREAMMEKDRQQQQEQEQQR